jgi:glyceraldehyde 3-phosphate dehydrogenase
VLYNQRSVKQTFSFKRAHKVLLTAPGKGVPNIVHGVNQNEYNPDDLDIFSAASVQRHHPILKAVEDTLGVCKGHLETIHSYTNDQNLVDNMTKNTVGRACSLNMVITETERYAVAKALPSLEGKLTPMLSCSCSQRILVF